jgi:membrane protein YqaA with SNARE-associated domain
VLAFILEMVPQYIAPQLFAFNAAIIGFGFWETTLCLYLGCLTGSVIGFELGRKYRGKLSRLLFEEEKIESVKEKVNNWGRYAILAAAISPIPYVPILFGALSLSRVNFIIFGLVPRFFYYLLFSVVAYAIF